MTWPFSGAWAPMTEGVVDVLGRPIGLSVIECGELRVPSGELLCCDPLADEPGEGPVVQVPAGSHRLWLTVADVSGSLDGSHLVEAYLSLKLAEGEEDHHRPLLPAGEKVGKGEFIGVEVETGTVALLDAGAFERCIPDLDDWADEIEVLLEDTEPVRDGVQLVALPEAEAEENAAICRAGWGNGLYPLVGSFSKDDELLAVHLDLEVVGTFE
jgi:hypothetical protein